MSFMEDLQAQRQMFIDGLEANQGDINLDIFEDFYPDKAHFVFELLQNAEDTGATECTFLLTADELRFRHNGKRQFGERDIKSITGIHNSTKTRSSDQIGKFGVGFKSVFIYTLTPQIHSGEYSFSIKNLVMPETINRIPDLGEDTLFCLPFNNPQKKAPEEAFLEIEQGLGNLSELTLLFLKNIGSVRWLINGEPSGRLFREEHSDHHIEVLKEANGEIPSSRHFLRFSQSVIGLESQHVCLAFPLGRLAADEPLEKDRPIHENFKIVSARPGRVSVFFPAEKESSRLRFHIHGPFVPTLDRSSVKDADTNSPLFAQVATFTAECLHKIRDLNLLSHAFLSVLPNPQDELPPRYRPIRDAIVREMRMEALTPTFAGGYAPAKDLVQAKANLKELLTADDIDLLVDYDEVPPQWAIAATQKNNNVDRFLTSLDIREWGIDQFINFLTKHFATPEFGLYFRKSAEHDDWLKSKSFDWFQKFYAILYREVIRNRRHLALKNLRIIRLTTGEISIPQECFFVSDDFPEDDVCKWVPRELFNSGESLNEQEDAQKFLIDMGVRNVGESERIELLLKARYQTKNFSPRLEDVELFIKHINAKPKDLDLFVDVSIFKREDDSWGSGGQIYIDDPYSDTGLRKVYAVTEDDQRKPLSRDYLSLPLAKISIRQFAEKLGAISNLEVSEVTCGDNPDWPYLSDVPGKNITTPIDRDYKIEGFEWIFDECDESLAIVAWDTLCNAEEEKTISGYLTATFQKSRKNGARHAPSQLVYQLRKTAWVPQQDGPSVAPPFADPKLLPRNGFFPFEPDWKWVEAVQFGYQLTSRIEAKEQEDEVLRKSLGIANNQSLDEIRELVRLFAKLPPDRRRKHIDEAQQELDFELPENEPKNEELRSRRVGEDAIDAPDRETEKRERSVSMNREAVKAGAIQYLIQQYTNDDQAMICQVCQRELPFKRLNGDYYFEAVEFITELELRHYQNYLALCPNHAAMFKHSNASKDRLKELFLGMGRTCKIDVDLANAMHSIYFTETHKVDFAAVINAEGPAGPPTGSP